MAPYLCTKYDEKSWREVHPENKQTNNFKLPETLTVFQTKIWDFLYPIWDLDKKFDTLFQTWSPGDRRVTSFYGAHTIVGVNIIREIDLSPITNDEEVANRSKKHTRFKTRVHKPYPISDQNG